MINLSSISGKSGQPWLSVYSATKAAVVGYTEAMSKELASAKIKSTALCPGFVDTDMTEFVKQQIPAEQMIRPQDIAEGVRFRAAAVARLHDPRDRVHAAGRVRRAGLSLEGGSPTMAMDCTYRLRIPHVAGQLAKVATRIWSTAA